MTMAQYMNRTHKHGLPERMHSTEIQAFQSQEMMMIDEGFTTKDSGERQQFASGMQRDVTTGKTKWHLVAPGPMLRRWALLMTRGAEKYDENNWMKASSLVEATRFKESAFRHFMQWYYGDTDEDHAAAVIFNINGFEYVSERYDND